MQIISVIRITLCVLTLAIGLAGCRFEDGNENENTPFKIVVVSDVHVRIPGNPDDYFYENQKNLDNIQQVIDQINGDYADADFVAITGDLVGCLFSEDPQDYLTGADTPAERFKQMFDNLILPYHVAFGNHDYNIGFDPQIGEHVTTLNREAVESVWEKVLETDPYYAFSHKGIQMIFLNSNRGAARLDTCSGLEVEAGCRGSFDLPQMDWLEECLQRPGPAILFCHHPPRKEDAGNLGALLFESYGIDPGDRFYEIAEQYNEKILAMFVGHWHIWQEYTLFDTIPVYQTGSVGDAFGSPENISIVEINPGLNRVKVTRHTPPQ